MITLKKQRSRIEAAISAPKPPVTGASWLICIEGSKHDQISCSNQLSLSIFSEGYFLTRSLPVFLTEASTVSLSQGIRVLRSISSQEIPSCKATRVCDAGDAGVN